MAGKKKSEANLTERSRNWGGVRNHPLAEHKTRGDLEKLLIRMKKHDHNVPGAKMIDPLSWWWGILQDDEQPYARRDQAALSLANFTIAKPKPIDSEGSSDNKVTIVIEQQTTPAVIHQPLPVIEHIINETEDD